MTEHFTKPKIPDNEKERLEMLYSYQLLEDEQKKEFDEIVDLAAWICKTPISLITLVDSSIQWHKAKYGDIVDSVDREVSFCAHAINQPEEIMIIEDAHQDERFKTNPLVTGQPHISFYAGVPLVTEEGFPLGALCVIDSKPKTLKKSQIKALKTLSKQVLRLFELNRTVREMAEKEKQLEQNIENLEEYTGFIAHDLRNPFRNIELTVEVLLKKHGSELDEECNTYLRDIITESQDARDFIIDLLQYSKTINVVNHDAEIVDTNQVISRVMKKLAPSPSIVITCHDEMPQLYYPKVALRHLFGNLIENAIKYNKSSAPTIDINYQAIEDDHIFTITDNGTNIDEGLVNIINKLFSGDLSSDGKFIKSIGLGLAIVNKLASLMGGNIELITIPRGGNSFRISLPIQQAL